MATLAARMIAYPEAALQSIRKLQLPSLSITIQLDIIKLGIKKQPIHHPYCQSKAGHKLFHCIKEVMNNHPSNSRERGITLSNLSEIKLEPKSKFTHSFVNISHVNARSISNKIIPFKWEICDEETDIYAITETWLKTEDIDSRLREIAPDGYNIIGHPRKDSRKGGGVALIYKQQYKVIDKTPENNTTPTMEWAAFHLRFKYVQVNLLIIYRIPNTSVLSFGNDLTDIIKNNIMLNRGTPLLIRDFKIHTGNMGHPDTVLFNDILDGLNLRNNMNFATHKSLHHLDLILNDREDKPITSVHRGLMLSDHCFTHAKIRTT